MSHLVHLAIPVFILSMIVEGMWAARATREDKDIIDPLRSFLTNRYAYLQAVMDLNVAISGLAVATGDDSVAEY